MEALGLLVLLVLVLAIMFVGMPFMMMGILHLFGTDIGYVPALVTYIAIVLVSSVLLGKKNG